MGHAGPEGELGGGHLIAGPPTWAASSSSCDTNESPFDQIGWGIEAG